MNRRRSVNIFNLLGKTTTPPQRVPPQGSLPEAADTALKINAIESEMAAAFARLDLPGPTRPRKLAQPARNASCQQAIEEAAVLYASGQDEAARTTLLVACATADSTPLAWGMLLEMCQIGALRLQFEQLSVAYARRFQASPPSWRTPRRTENGGAQAVPPPATFEGPLLDGSLPELQRLLAQAERQRALHLTFAAVDLAGCRHLLHLLQQVQAGGHALEIGGADSLLAQVRTLVEPGRPDADQGAWLLLIEVLRLMRNAQEHEDACVAYCVTYEISPPLADVPTGAPERRAGSAFPMPELVAKPLDALLQEIRAHALRRSVLLLDCTNLLRVEFTAAAPLLDGLLQAAEGKPVECRHVNFLVSVLLRLVGGDPRLHVATRTP